jgi:hypothetical protein
MDKMAKVFLPLPLLSTLAEKDVGSMPLAKAEMSTISSLPDPFLVAVKATVS